VTSDGGRKNGLAATMAYNTPISWESRSATWETDSTPTCSRIFGKRGLCADHEWGRLDIVPMATAAGAAGGGPVFDPGVDLWGSAWCCRALGSFSRARVLGPQDFPAVEHRLQGLSSAE